MKVRAMENEVMRSRLQQLIYCSVPSFICCCILSGISTGANSASLMENEAFDPTLSLFPHVTYGCSGMGWDGNQQKRGLRISFIEKLHMIQCLRMCSFSPTRSGNTHFHLNPPRPSNDSDHLPYHLIHATPTYLPTSNLL